MIGRTVRYGIYSLGLMITIVLSILTADIASMPVPAPLPFGIALVVFAVFMELLTENWRWKTCQITCNFAEEDISGHFSIRDRDVFFIPWDFEVDVDGVTIKNSIQMAICMTGSIDYWCLSTQGSPKYPVMIFPAIYLQKMGSNYICHANLKPRTLDEMDLDLAIHLIKMFPHRIKNPKRFWRWEYGGTPIYFGTTSPIDGTETIGNLNYESKITQLNKTIDVLVKELDNTREQFKKREDMKQKPFLIAEKIKRDEE